jgi:hypothetical protein
MLVYRYYTGYPATIFGNAGMVSKKNRPSLGSNAFILTKNKRGPVSGQRIKRPRRYTEKNVTLLSERIKIRQKGRYFLGR